LTREAGRPWARFRPRFTLGRMMIAVAVAALLVVIWKNEGGSPAAGAVIVAACVVILAFKLARDAIAREQGGGKTIGRWRKLRIVMESSAIAVVIIGSADFTFLSVYSSFIIHTHSRRIEVPKVILGGLAAVVVAVLLRLTILSTRDLPAPSGSPDGFPDEVHPEEWT